VRLRCAALAAFCLLGISNAFAVATMPTTGTCGFLGTLQYPFVYLYPNPGPGWGMNIIATLNLDTKTINGNIVIQNPAGPNSTESQASFSGPFTVTAGPFTGSSTINATLTFSNNAIGRTSFAWNVVPVNGGNTLLMQEGPGPVGGADGGMAGVCQF